MIRILTVCLGNICRSPVAEAVVREEADSAGLKVEVDSAGTGAYHIGEPPDARMRQAGSEVGITVSGSARQVSIVDFDDFDVIVAMDKSNLRHLRQMAPTETAASKVHLFRDFDSESQGKEVPDPYYGTIDDYRAVIKVVRPAARGLIETLKEEQL